jgi:hypothetical protein
VAAGAQADVVGEVEPVVVGVFVDCDWSVPQSQRPPAGNVLNEEARLLTVASRVGRRVTVA